MRGKWFRKQPFMPEPKIYEFKKDEEEKASA